MLIEQLRQNTVRRGYTRAELGWVLEDNDVVNRMIQGVGGVIAPPPGWLAKIRETCDRHDILMVADEVITGFGRMGTPFATQKFNVKPDIITMAKALTNGAIPMGGVAVTDEIYETVTNAAPENAIEFFHGYTSSNER